MKSKIVLFTFLLICLFVIFFSYWVITEPKPFDGVFYLNVANKYLEEGNYQKAEEALSKVNKSRVINEFPKYSSLYNSLNEDIKNNINKGFLLRGLSTDNWLIKNAQLKLNKIEIIEEIEIPIVKLSFSAPNIENFYPIKLSLYNGNSLIDEHILENAGDYDQYFTIDKTMLLDKESEFNFICDKAFIPKDKGISDDARELSLFIKEFEIVDYKDVFSEEDRVTINNQTADAWIGKHTSISIVNLSGKLNGLSVNYNNLFLENAVLDIKYGDELLKEVELEKGQQVIQIELETLKDFTFEDLEFEISDTFVPKELGISDDVRELGIIIESIELIY